MAVIFTRRTFVAALAAVGGATLVGCGRSPRRDASGAAQSGATPPTAATARSGVAMTVFRDPSCGCCESWAEIARNAGYDVKLVDRPDMPAIKRQHGVPDELASCHTALVAGFVIEGHVPLSDVDHLLDKRPDGVRGLAVAGMPRGSPGMEMPDGSKDPFQVLAFDAAGKSSLFHS